MTTVVFAYNDYDNILVLNPHSIIDDKYVDQSDIATINMLFIEGLKPYIKNIESSTSSCKKDDCALAELSKSTNNKVVYTQLQKLGDKIIFSGSILDNDGTSFQSRATAMNLEDMENVCIRLAKSIALQESIEEVADIDNITEKEEEEPLRRTSLSRIGMNVGYYFPFGNSFANESRVLKFGANYYYSFQNNTALMGEFSFGGGARYGFFGAELSTMKFINNVDTSPFYGFGLGLHTVSSGEQDNYYHDTNHNGHYDANDDTIDEFGTSLSILGGVMLYRTYDVNVIARAKYLHVFNTNSDNAFMIDIVFQMKRKERSRNRVINRYPLIEALLGS